MNYFFACMNKAFIYCDGTNHMQLERVETMSMENVNTKYFYWVETNYLRVN